MKRVTLNSAKRNDETSVPNVFLDTYMRDANGEFVKVYLYLLRCMNTNNACTDISDIADRLNLTEKDVLRALKYWDAAKVIDVVFDPAGGEPVSITFLPLEPDSGNDMSIREAAAVKEEPGTEIAEPKELKTAQGSKSYSLSKIRRLCEQEDIRELLYAVEQYIGKPLTSTETRTVCYIYSELNFSSELIEYLVDYCVSNNHRSMRYIEQVALNWHSEGINSVLAAKQKNEHMGSRTLAVIKTFGLGNRSITPGEMEFINRWYDEYGFDKDMVTEACRRTILSLSKPNFSYADGILKKWRNAHIKTMDDLKTLDSGFRAKITIPVSAPMDKPSSNNRFNNFTQRTYNFDELEKKLVSNNK